MNADRIDATRTPILVAGLHRRNDRRQAIQEQMDKQCVTNVQFAADLGLVVDWKSWQQAEIERLATKLFSWCVPESANPFWNRCLKLGEIACTLTHWNIWTYAHEQRFPCLIVVEDDAELLSGFDRREEAIASLFSIDTCWDLLFLGRERLEPDRGRVGRFTYPGFSYCTHGYALSQSGIRSLLGTSLPDCIIPVDEFLPAMYMRHPREDICECFPQRITAYGLAEDIVGVKSDAYWGSDTEDSPVACDGKGSHEAG